MSFINVMMTSGELLNTLQGTLNFAADASQLTGLAFTAANSTSNVTFTNGTHWEMNADSNVTNLTNNASTIDFTPPVNGTFKTLTTVNYVGTGGTIGLNTFLGTDGSPSDKLVINGGMATGTTVLRIDNAGGPGALTTGNGIQVVQAMNGATTAPGSFTLGGAEVRAGAFNYQLFMGGVSDPESWFLRSDFVPVPGPPGPDGQPAPPIPGVPPNLLPPSPPLGPLPPGVAFPIIGPEIATYGVVQPIAREMGLATLGTLHERVGDPDGSCCCTAVTTCCSATTNVKAPSGAGGTETATATQTTVTSTGSCNQPVAWGRVIGQTVDNRYQQFGDPQATGQIMGFQTGFDLWRGSLIPGHTDTAGVYLAYVNASIDVNGLVTNQAASAYVMTHTGNVGLNGYSGGAYWTHYGPGGWYVDAVVQGTGYEGNAQTQNANLPLNGYGFVSSLEGGYPIPIPVWWLGPRFVLEPQGQIIWQQVAFRGSNDGLGPVDPGTTSGFTGRLGLRGKWTFVTTGGMVWQPYVQANIWRDWDAEANTMFGGDQVPLIEQATRLEFLGGVTAKLNDKWSIHGQAGYQFATGETDPNPYRRDGFEGDIGFRYTW